MSVRGEYRRIGGDLLTVLRNAGRPDSDPRMVALVSQLERAADDLAGAAEDTGNALPALRGMAPEDPELRHRFDDAYERLEAICRIILGR